MTVYGCNNVGFYAPMHFRACVSCFQPSSPSYASLSLLLIPAVSLSVRPVSHLPWRVSDHEKSRLVRQDRAAFMLS